MDIRPFRAGDDLALNEVLHDAQDPAAHVARNLFRANSDSPVLRCVVALLDGTEVVVGAAALTESPAHPTRAWAHVEVAESERSRGAARALLTAVREQTQGTAVAGLPLRARVSAGTVGEDAARAAGFQELFTTRVVRVQPTALGGLGADRLDDFTVTATGSVVLTQAFAQWYAGVNRVDPAAEMTIGQVNQRFLSESAGAHGAALMRSAGSGAAGEVSAFAVSYAQRLDEQQSGFDVPGGTASGGTSPGATGGAGSGATGGVGDEIATELTLGSLYDARSEAPDPESPEFQRALGDAGALLARLNVDVPVVLEVTSQMPVVNALIDGLLDAERATVLHTYVTLGLD